MTTIKKQWIFFSQYFLENKALDASKKKEQEGK